jgi:hypothetical protein
MRRLERALVPRRARRTSPLSKCAAVVTMRRLERALAPPPREGGQVRCLNDARCCNNAAFRKGTCAPPREADKSAF